MVKLQCEGVWNIMSNCIYCGATDVTVEHPLPRALGNFKGYMPLEDRLCHRCNVICGQLDEQLCRCGSEAFFRKFLGISGRVGHDEVNSFYRGSSRGGRLEMMGTNHDTGEEKELELAGPDEVRELRCVKLTAEDDSTYTRATIKVPRSPRPEFPCIPLAPSASRSSRVPKPTGRTSVAFEQGR